MTADDRQEMQPSHGPGAATGLTFLEWGGDTAARMRAKDWSTSPLGPPETWPQSLRAIVGLMLSSKFPMFIAWGPELGFLYNDPYTEVLGAKHPDALGARFQDVWSEVWPDISPFIDAAMAGEAVYREDLNLVLNRKGFDEETWFTFSYSPVRDEDGVVAGMLCVCTETTGKVLAGRGVVLERERLEQLFAQAPGFMAMMRGPGHVFELINRAYKQLIGHRDVIGKPVREALPDIEGQGFFELLDNVYQRGEVFKGNSLKVYLQRTPDAAPEERYVDLVYQPVTDSDGRVTGIFAEGSDVTERVRAEEALREREERLRLVVEAAQDHAIITTDMAGLIATWNAGAEAIFGWSSGEAIGQPASILFTPEDRAAGTDKLELRTAAENGSAADERWHVRQDGRLVYMTGSVHPLRDAEGREQGFIKIARNETERRQVDARRLALVELGDRIRDVDDPADLAFAAAEILGRTLRVSRAGYGTIDTRSETISIERDWNSPGIKSLAGVLHFRDYGSYIDDLKRGETVVCEDADHDPRTAATADALKAISAQAFVNMPVTEQGGFVALLYLNHATAREWPPEELAFVREVAERTRTAVERRRAEHDLRELAASLEREVSVRTAERNRVWEMSRDLFAIMGFDGYLKLVNPAWTATLGWDEATLLARPFAEQVHPDDHAPAADVLAQLRRGEAVDRFEDRLLHADGTWRWIAWALVPEGDVFYAVGRDITPEKEAAAELERAQEQLRQAQKMEAVGQLTGGIAHDFNNLLAGIVGALDLMQTRLAQGRTDSIERYAKAAMSSAQRAAALTHRLLAFSRRQPLDPKPVSANSLVTSMEDLLRRTIGPLHALEIVTAGGLWTALCDPNQLESAILNLAINARDAMPDGGRLTIETCNAHLDDAYVAAQRDIAPGQYICICVTDTGTGMPASVMERAFEPFFTTKPLGQGTGLGLSMVYGFAKQSEGHLKIYSEEGKGTTVKIYLPRHRGAAAPDVLLPSTGETPRAASGETVLVVEDEPVIRDLIVELLQDLGYRALEAADGPAGLAILQSRERIDLLVTDVGLPGLNGRQLADRARERRPDLKVLFITGYAENATLANGFLEPGMEMITKPFAVETLATKIRTMFQTSQ